MTDFWFNVKINIGLNVDAESEESARLKLAENLMDYFTDLYARGLPIQDHEADLIKDPPNPNLIEGTATHTGIEKDVELFKCRTCGLKYNPYFIADKDQGICRWCSGEAEKDKEVESALGEPAPTNGDWAEAISCRLADEWSGKKDFPEDANLLQKILMELFTKHPELCKKLIGTGIIEEDYFEFQEHCEWCEFEDHSLCYKKGGKKIDNKRPDETGG